MNQKSRPKFTIVALGIIIDPKTNKILVCRSEKNTILRNSFWVLPGCISEEGFQLDKSLRKKIKNKIGIHIKKPRPIFAKKYLGKKDLISVYYLCEIGKKTKDSVLFFNQFKWVNLSEIDNNLIRKLHPKLKKKILESI